LASVQARLEPLDIKTTTDYVTGQTTHVVVAKRNTPKGLQALIDGRYVVTTAFVDAVVQASSAQNSDTDNYIPSLFELDFDTHWPNELEYLPPAGQEPVPRSKDFFKPKVERREIFSGHTFIFCDEGQIENLRGPITTGGGKALLYNLIWGQTTVEEFVQYVKNIAGKKGIGQFEDQNDSKGVVVVRFTQPETDEWARDFVQNVDLALNQRSVNQNEFLDAILINDARSLRKELEEDTEVSSSIPSRIGTVEIPRT
jgi:nibrin